MKQCYLMTIMDLVTKGPDFQTVIIISITIISLVVSDSVACAILDPKENS